MSDKNRQAAEETENQDKNTGSHVLSKEEDDFMDAQAVVVKAGRA